MTDQTSLTERSPAGAAARIERVDVHDDAAMTECFAILHAACLAEHPDDPLPTAAEVMARVRTTEHAVRSEFWLLREDDTPAGMCWLDLPLLDNLELMETAVGVVPDYQHRGHGRALVDHMRNRALELGRHQLIGSVNEPADGTTSRPMRFAAATGARRALGELRRTLDLAGLDRERLALLRSQAEAAATGYSLVSWTGACPADLVDDYAGLLARMVTDAPMGDLGIEPENWDAQRVREVEAVSEAQARTRYVTAARAGEDGPLVAFTELVHGRHDPSNAFQWDTLVRRDHRGHRLGLLVKLANFNRLLAAGTAARRVHTWNADENAFMIAINEAMGFRVAQREAEWRLDLPQAPR